LGFVEEFLDTIMKIITVVGARPQFIKAAPICNELTLRGHDSILVHTGQHYDYKLSKVFFDELGIPEPKYNLEIGSTTAAKQIAGMISGLESIFMQEKSDCVLVLGDTNSTLAAALTAVKCDIPVAHIEGGERNFTHSYEQVPSFTIPEEANRVVVDHISSIILCASHRAVDNLVREGITKGVAFVGDISLDTYTLISNIPSNTSTILEQLGLETGGYALATVHRSINTDRPERLKEIILGLSRSKVPVILPVHPRTQKVIREEHLGEAIPQNSQLRIIDPVGYFDMLTLEKNARIIVTDSGGVIREAFFSKVPSLIVDETTEWIDLVQAGWSQLIGADSEKITQLIRTMQKPEKWDAILGDGSARQKIVSYLEDWSSR
jgi:UDP-GlcNAc3NAcA epimerase